ncbi:MAG: DNA-3-methyladenine glycosylase 2 family protein [Acidobacteria bacterium]|nr:DNA-3-methyladenine glycosylase 2 family protein [Acidobacteriota bacterium]
MNASPTQAARALAEADPRLGRLIADVGPCRLAIEALQSPFQALAEAIVYQQLTGKAAATILGRVVDRFRPKRFPSPQDILRTADDRLRAAGLSRAKVAAIKDLAARTLDGTVPSLAALRKMQEEEIVTRLTAIRGVGRWTVEMLLIFRLGRPDVLPAGDYGIRKGFARAFGTRALPTPQQVLRRGDRWRPHRTVASWYLWRALDSAAKNGRRRAR